MLLQYATKYATLINTYGSIILFNGQKLLVMEHVFLLPESVMSHQATESLYLLLVFSRLSLCLALEDVFIHIPHTNEHIGGD